MKHVFDRLNDIAAVIEPFEAEWLRAWVPDSSLNMDAALTASAAKVNEAIEPFIDEVAKVTNNSADTIRQAYRPRHAYHVWFGGDRSASEFLRNVAKHSSFNTNFWAENERRADEQALKDTYIAAAGSTPAPVVSPTVAAVEIAAGRVPRVDERLLQQLKAELLIVGVLEMYNQPRDRDSFSATRSFAYVADVAGEFRFWPKNRAMNHVQATPIAALQAASPDSVAPDAPKRPRPRP
jgi:hypothetical protein